MKTLADQEIKSGKAWLKKLAEKRNKQCKICYVGSDPTRVKILFILDRFKKICVSDIAKLTGVSVSAVSHQLALIERYNIVTKDKQGKMIYYSLADGEICFFLQSKLINKKK